jgi:ABC-type lipoprotein release transport system permease subunit
MVNSFDVVSYAGGAIVVVLAAIAAALEPAHRAARTRPVVTLRAD